MHPAATCTRVAFGVATLLIGSATASAQTVGYVAATAFADIRQFGSTSSRAVIPGDDFSMDATGLGGSVRVGTWLHPRWTLEVGADVGSKTTVDFENPIIIQIFPPPTPLNLKSSSRFVTVSTMVGFHPPAVGRLRLGYLAGFSFVRATYKTDFPGLAIPASIVDGVFASLPIVPPRFNRATLTQKHNTGALALGFEAAIDLSTKIAVVPELRALTFSTPGAGPGVFLIRPGVGVRWKF
jgi:hypothetical protein